MVAPSLPRRPRRRAVLGLVGRPCGAHHRRTQGMATAIGSVSNVQPIGLTADPVTLGAYERGCLAILLRVARVCADRQSLTTTPDARPNQRRQCAQVISSALSRLEEGGARLWRPKPNGTPGAAMLRAGLLAVTLSLIAGSVDCGRQVQHRCLLDILSPEHDAPKHQCQKTAYVRRAAQRARTPQLHELHCYQGSSERSVRWPLLGTMASTSRMEANRRESPAVH
jgi:hypothetical protein